jgi:hypothetical protein
MATDDHADRLWTLADIERAEVAGARRFFVP